MIDSLHVEAERERPVLTLVKPEENNVDHLASFEKKLNIMSTLVRGVAKGALPGTIISGPPGIGKSFTTFQILKDEFEGKTIHPYKGKTTPLSLYNNLLMASEPDNIVVFDDNDSVFNDITSLNIVKAVLDPTSNREVTWSSTSGKVDVPRFRFHGGLIILTNAELKTNPHFSAFLDRLHCYQMRVTLQERIAKIEEMASSYHDKKVAVDVIKFMVEHINLLRTKLSLRTFARIAELVELDPDNWRDIALYTVVLER